MIRSGSPAATEASGQQPDAGGAGGPDHAPRQGLGVEIDEREHDEEGGERQVGGERPRPSEAPRGRPEQNGGDRRDEAGAARRRAAFGPLGRHPVDDGPEQKADRPAGHGAQGNQDAGHVSIDPSDHNRSATQVPLGSNR